MTEQQPTFAELCEQAMDVRHETYQGMADFCGVSWRTWERWLKGKSAPYPTEAKRFAGRCGFSEDMVFDAIERYREQKKEGIQC